MICYFNDFINENNTWKDMGTVLVYGVPDENNKRNLFMFRLKSIKNHPRIKTDKSDASPVYMATLYPELYTIRLKDDMPIAVRTMNTALQTRVGLKDFSVGLKWSKTPLHNDSVKEPSYGKFLKEHADEIKNLPNVKF